MGDKNKETFGIEKQRTRRDRKKENPIQEKEKVKWNQGILSNPRKFIRASVRLTMANRTSKEGGIRKSRKGEREKISLQFALSTQILPLFLLFFGLGEPKLGRGGGEGKIVEVLKLDSTFVRTRQI